MIATLDKYSILDITAVAKPNHILSKLHECPTLFEPIKSYGFLLIQCSIIMLVVIYWQCMLCNNYVIFM